MRQTNNSLLADRALPRMDGHWFRHPPTVKCRRHCRLNEISFNSPLIKELRMAALLRKVADPGTGEGAVWAKMRIHRVAGEEIMLQLGYSSKPLAEWAFFQMLRDEGRRAAEMFLEDLWCRHWGAVDAEYRSPSDGGMTPWDCSVSSSA